MCQCVYRSQNKRQPTKVCFLAVETPRWAEALATSSVTVSKNFVVTFEKNRYVIISKKSWKSLLNKNVQNILANSTVLKVVDYTYLNAACLSKRKTESSESSAKSIKCDPPPQGKRLDGRFFATASSKKFYF